MRNYINEGEVIEVAAPYAVISGAGVQVGAGLFGVASHDAALGAAVNIKTAGVFDLTALAADTAAVGAKLFWDNTNKRLTTTASTHICAGVAVAAKAAAETTARVKLLMGFDKA